MPPASGRPPASARPTRASTLHDDARGTHDGRGGRRAGERSGSQAEATQPEGEGHLRCPCRHRRCRRRRRRRRRRCRRQVWYFRAEEGGLMSTQ